MCLDKSRHVSGNVSEHVSGHVSGLVSGHVSAHVSGPMFGHMSEHVSGYAKHYGDAGVCLQLCIFFI